MSIMFNLFKKRKSNNTLEKYYGKSSYFLTSYPKSGNTWVRMFLAKYLFGDKIGFGNLNEFIPPVHKEILFNVDYSYEKRIFKSHFNYTPKYQNVIYLVRDGRDVSVSYYFHLKRLGHIPSSCLFKEFLKDYFLTGNLKFGKWDEHVTSWLSNKNNHNQLMIKYEDLVNNPENSFFEIINFIGANYDQSVLKNGIKETSFSNLRKRELTEGVAEFNSTEDLTFIRKGEIGDWKNYFDKEDEDRFLNVNKSLMLELGYIL